MKKILLSLLLVSIAAVGVAYWQLGAIVKKAVEAYAPKMVGAPVTVGLVTLSPFSGQGRLRGLRIGNPPGYTSPSAIEVGDLRVSVDLKSLIGKGRILVKEVVVERPRITVETGKGGTNLQQLQRNLESYAPSSPGEQAKTEGRRIEIGLFRLTGGQAVAVVPQLRSAPVSVAIPDLELRGIGDKPGGATMAEAARQVMAAVTSAAIRAAGGAPALFKKGLDALGSGAVDKLRGLFKKK